MRKLYSFVIAASCFIAANVFSITGSAQTLSGTYTLPGLINGISVTNLTDLAAVLNGADVNGTVVMEFTSSYSTSGEVFPITFNGFTGIGNVVIRPAASVSSMLYTSGAPSTKALIDLEGVQNLTFDGRPDGVGTSIYWQFQNTANGSLYPAFRFINGASYDTLQYLYIQSSSAYNTGSIVFSTSTLPRGNSYDVIQNCDVYNYLNYQYNPILSAGTAGSPNHDNGILNNNIFNFVGYYASGPYGGVNITGTGSGSNWTITGNSFYATSSTGDYYLTAICFLPGTNSTNNIISDNYIGGSQPLCAGPVWSFRGYNGYTYSPDFQGIYVNAGGTTMVTNNTIQNIRLLGSTSQSFCGIRIGSSSSAVVSGNLVGSPTDTNSIHAGGMGVTIGIWHQSSASVTIDNNIIANLTSDNGFPPTSWTYGDVIGIYGYSSSTVLGQAIITNNQIYNLTTSTNQNINQYYPINNGSGLSNAVITYQNSIMAGISVKSAGNFTNTISKNTIYGLQTTITGSSSAAYIYGITQSGGASSINNINGNFVYGLSAPNNYGTSNAFIGLTGIYLPTSFAGVYNITNNLIALGYRSSDGTTTQRSCLSGIWDNDGLNSPTLKIRLYHNSIFLGGTDVLGLNSYGIRRALSFSSAAYDSLDVQNNIVLNNRTSPGLQFGLYYNSPINVKSDYNDVYGTGTGFNYGATNSTAYTTLALFRSNNAGMETHSIFADPQYLNAPVATPDLRITSTPSISPVDQAGTSSATLVYDYDSLVRASYTPVDIGAMAVTAGSCTVSVTLASTATTVCEGNNVTFTATANNGGTAPTYNFYVNGVSVQNGSANTYSNSSLHNNDSVKVVMTSNATCATQFIATSNFIPITVRPVSTSSITQSICQGQSYLGHTTNGTFNDTLHNAAANGCDSIRTLHLTVLNSASSNIQQSICQGQTYLGHSTSGTFNDTLHNAAANGCDSIRTLHLTVLNNVTSSISQSVCQGQTYLGHNATGTFNDTLHNAAANGCDSIRTLHLTVLNSVTSNISQTICHGASYGGHNVAGTYTDTLHNAAANGCDSIRVLNLTVSPIITSNVSHSICQGQTYEGHNAAGTYVDTFHTVNNCDSIRTLVLAVQSVILTNDAQTICAGGTYDGYSQTGVFVDTFQALGGCDSVRTLNLTVLPNSASSVTQTVCFGQSFGGHNATGTFIDTLHGGALNGCDSVVTLHLTVLPQIATTVSHTMCQGETFEGHNTAGTYIDTLTAASNCDSIYTLHLIVFANYNDTITQAICQGDTLAGHTATGVYVDSLHSVGGCDSIVTLNLTVNALPTAAITQSGFTLISSVGLAYQWFLGNSPIINATNNTYVVTQNGLYSVVVTDVNGCSNTSSQVQIAGVGINEISSNPSLSIYPNPTDGLLNLSLTDLSGTEGIEIKLIDAIGKVVMHTVSAAQGNGVNTQLHLNDLPQGLYMVQITQGGWSVSKRIVVARW